MNGYDLVKQTRIHDMHEVVQVALTLFKHELQMTDPVYFTFSAPTMDIIRGHKNMRNTRDLLGSTTLPSYSPAIMLINLPNIETIHGLFKVVFHELLHIKYPDYTEREIRKLVKRRGL